MRGWLIIVLTALTVAACGSGQTVTKTVTAPQKAAQSATAASASLPKTAPIKPTKPHKAVVTETYDETGTTTSPPVPSACPAGLFDPYGPQGGCYTTAHPSEETNPVSCPAGKSPSDGGCMSESEIAPSESGTYTDSDNPCGTRPSYAVGAICSGGQWYPTNACVGGNNQGCNPSDSAPCTASDPCTVGESTSAATDTTSYCPTGTKEYSAIGPPSIAWCGKPGTVSASAPYSAICWLIFDDQAPSGHTAVKACPDAQQYYESLQ